MIIKEFFISLLLLFLELKFVLSDKVKNGFLKKENSNSNMKDDYMMTFIKENYNQINSEIQNSIRKEINTEKVKENSKFNSEEMRMLMNNQTLSFSSEAEEKVVFVFTLFRHGARAPYALENGKDSIGVEWNINKNELTNVGLRQHYILGLLQREKYNDLLSNEYKPGEVYAISTNRNRTIMSFLAHYQGLYSKGAELTDEQIEKAMPPGNNSDDLIKLAHSTKAAVGDYVSTMPFHIIDKNKYFNFKSYCSGIDEYSKERGENIEKNVLDIADKQGEFLKQFGIVVTKSNIYESRLKLWAFADSYIAEYYEKNLKVKYDTDEKEKKLMEDLEEFIAKDSVEGSFSENNAYNARILNSKLFDNLFNNYFEPRMYKYNKKDYTYDYLNPKMLIYSAHDSNIAPLMAFFTYALKTPTDNIPFASIYNIELVRVNSNSYSEVKTEINTENFKIRIFYNGKKIYYEDYSVFKENVTKAMINLDEVDNFCGFGTKSLVFYIIIIVSLSLLIVVMLIYLCIHWTKKKNLNEEEENRTGSLGKYENIEN